MIVVVVGVRGASFVSTTTQQKIIVTREKRKKKKKIPSKLSSAQKYI